MYEDVTIGPRWLKQRLMAGQRLISNVVDITNYVMLAIGQPLHFDLDEVRGAHRPAALARARPWPLDDVERTFGAEAALVCDGEGKRDRRDHGRPDLRGLRLDNAEC